jgi:hypothetical protein
MRFDSSLVTNKLFELKINDREDIKALGNKDKAES